MENWIDLYPCNQLILVQLVLQPITLSSVGHLMVSLLELHSKSLVKWVVSNFSIPLMNALRALIHALTKPFALIPPVHSGNS